MRIAVTSENGMVFQHFGATPEFVVYTISGGKITDRKVVSTNGTGHEALVGILLSLDVDALICGGIGGGARYAVASAGIELYPGVFGAADDAAKALAEGKLQFNAETVCSHHGDDAVHHCHGNCRH